MSLTDRVQERFGPLMHRAGSRLRIPHGSLPNEPAWMITRVVEAFEEDYELQIWLMTAPESEVRTVTDGYQQLVDALNHDSTAAARDARRALEMPLPQACAMFVRRWYQAVFEREQGENRQDLPHRE